MFKSTGIQVWPILGLFEGSYPFLIAVFCGERKPNSCEDFLKDFLEEYEHLEQDGLTIKDQHYTLKLHSVICDLSARQFLKCVKGHGGFHACERCTIKGEKIEHKWSLFLQVNLCELMKFLIIMAIQDISILQAL